jgi:hypothetical protein
MRLALSLLWLACAAVAHGQEYPDPKRFENEILRYEEQDRAQMPPTDAIVLTGSSSIARWGNQAPAALAPLTVIPRGFGGSTMRDLAHYLDRVAIAYQPRAILIYEGDRASTYCPSSPASCAGHDGASRGK